MKRIALIASLVAIVCSCEKNLDMSGTEYGYISLDEVSADATLTKASQTVTDLSSWTAVVSLGETEKYNGRASTVGSQALAAGTYSVKVYNYADDAAASAANGKWGAARYEGTNSSVAVTAGSTVSPSIDCGKAKNARLKVVFHESFTEIAQDYSLVTTGDRALTFNNSTSDKAAYYAAGASVGYTISYKMKSNTSETKTITDKSVTLGVAATEKTITLKGNANGTISISITYDDEFTPDGNEEITIDGATGGVVSNS